MIPKQDRPHILIADNDDYVCELLTYLLSSEDFFITRVVDGKQALEYIANDPPPALAIIEYILPYVEGVQVVRKLRDNTHWHQVPVIMLSDMSPRDDIKNTWKYGINCYIAKPFQPEDLINKVKDLTQHNE